MKKLLVIVAAIAMAFSFASCKSNGQQYTGTYVGTYTFFKENNAANPDSTKTNQKLPVLQLTDASVSMYDVIPLDKASEGIYKKSELGNTLFVSLLQLIGLSSSTSDKITAINMTADFTSTNNLTFTVSYDVDLGLGKVEVRVMQFVGSKQ